MRRDKTNHLAGRLFKGIALLSLLTAMIASRMTTLSKVGSPEDGLYEIVGHEELQHQDDLGGEVTSKIVIA